MSPDKIRRAARQSPRSRARKFSPPAPAPPGFRAAHAEQFHAARQLPALRHRNRRADARVTARPQADGNHFNFFARNFRRRQDFFNQAERIRRPRRRLSTASASTTPSRASATLRCADENSSAKIVINNFPFRLAHNFNFHSTNFFHLPAFHLPLRNPLRPFNHRHAVRRQKFFDARRSKFVPRVSSRYKSR